MVNSMNVLVLAYLGDCIYEVYVRKYLIEQGISKVQKLQKLRNLKKSIENKSVL